MPFRRSSTLQQCPVTGCKAWRAVQNMLQHIYYVHTAEGAAVARSKGKRSATLEVMRRAIQSPAECPDITMEQVEDYLND